MANKDFGVKKIELIGSSGTPNLTSPTNLNLNANTVAISTDVTIGGKVQSDVIVGTGYSVGIGSTQPQQALDVTGDIIVTGGITATTFSGSGASLTSIPNSALDNSSVSYGGVSLSLGGSDATPAFNLSDATNYPYTSLTGITTEIVGDTTPQLGGDLDVNSNDITGTGNLNITGVITATTFDGPLKGLPQNAQTSAYVLVAGDAGKNVAITTGGVTVNTGVFDVGDTVSIYNDSEYTQMINVGSGVTMRRVSVGDTGDRGLNQYGLATIMCIRNNEFVISGAGLT